MRHPVRVPALQQDQAEQEQPDVGLPLGQAERAVHDVVGRGHHRDEDAEDDQRGEPPPAEPRRDHEERDAEVRPEPAPSRAAAWS